MSNDTFNPLLFLESTVTEALTTRASLPEGEYVGVIQPLNENSFSSGTISKGDRTGQTWRSINLRIEVNLLQYPEVQQQVGVDKVSLFHRIFLDLTETGNLDTGKDRNRALRQLREALGQNKAGVPWSMQMVVGQPIRVSVKHEPQEDGSTRESVDKVAGI